MNDVTDTPIEILIHRAAAARADMRRTAAVADQANTAASDARRLSDEAQAAVLVKLNELMDASDREAAESREAAARVRAGTGPITARARASLESAHQTVDLADAFEAERADTGGGACA